MSTLLKFLIIVASAALFIYCARLAILGQLEMEVMVHDALTFKSYIKTEFWALIDRYR